MEFSQTICKETMGQRIGEIRGIGWSEASDKPNIGVIGLNQNIRNPESPIPPIPSESSDQSDISDSSDFSDLPSSDFSENVEGLKKCIDKRRNPC